MSIYIQDTALENCLEPLEEKLLLLPSQAKCTIFFPHSKTLDQDKIADVALQYWDIFYQEKKMLL